jgi:hypothetical protein
MCVVLLGKSDKVFSVLDNNMCYIYFANFFFARLLDLVGVLDWRGLQSTL